ncbi:hypothetical protein B0A55_07508, partial [Friedmanniomyces simplex]
MTSNDLTPEAASNDTAERILGEYQADHAIDASMDSDSDGVHEQLEVIFDQSAAQRRRASLNPSTSNRPSSQRQKTSCFVHQLLEEKSKSGQWTPSTDILSDRTADKDTPEDQHNGDETQRHTQSRLLTKKQLSDMAFGIRELSKKLGHIRLLLKVRNVFLLTKAHDQKLIANTRDMTQYLLKNTNEEGQPYVVWVEETMRDNAVFNAKGLLDHDPSYKDRLRYWTNELCAKKPHTFEICIALGGDGTVLYASWLFQRVVPPVMSFALGSL